jgi:hypothetical protein
MPGAAIVASERLDRPDVYWYSHHHARPLPVLRLVFDDDAATWLTIDLATARIAAVQTREDRVYRWLFNLAHQYDLPVLLAHPVLRDILVWSLSVLGLIVSLSGVIIGWRYLRRRPRPVA